MSSQDSAPDDEEQRAAAPHSRSGRKLTRSRRLLYQAAVYCAVLLIEVLWRTARIRFVGEESLKRSIAEHGAVVPVCWHQHLIMCSRYLVAKRIPGLKAGFMISPSVDGEAPSMLANAYGGEVIRGSGTYTGPRAVRRLYKAIVREKLTPLITPDGPRGPRFEFKGGAILVAQLCGVPIVPLAFAARPAHVFRTWDKFVLPWPFARIAIVLGEPVSIPRELDEARSAALAKEMAARLHQAFLAAQKELHPTK